MLLVSSTENVAVIESEILGVKVKVGLDSMSSMSLLFSSILEKLQGVVKEKRQSVSLRTAVGNVSFVVNEFVTVSVSILKNEGRMRSGTSKLR